MKNGDYPYRITWATCREPLACSGCGAVIRPGDRYRARYTGRSRDGGTCAMCEAGKNKMPAADWQNFMSEIGEIFNGEESQGEKI